VQPGSLSISRAYVRAREGWRRRRSGPARFGPVFHRLTFGEAIERDLLSDYQVVVVGVSDSTYREYAERGVFVTPDGKRVTDARTLASQLGLLRAMAEYDLHRVVSFHSRIRSAESFAHSLPEVCAWLPADRRPGGALWAARVSGDMTSGERDSRLNRLRAVERPQRGVLTNARCLAEGVDVPTLDGVAFIEPRRSQIDIVQASAPPSPTPAISCACSKPSAANTTAS
jgi:predicted helicase